MPAAIVAETAHTISFLDHRPIFPGHTLVVPRSHVETLRDLPADLVEPYFSEVQRVTAAVQDAMGAQGTFVAENNVVSHGYTSGVKPSLSGGAPGAIQAGGSQVRRKPTR